MEWDFDSVSVHLEFNTWRGNNSLILIVCCRVSSSVKVTGHTQVFQGFYYFSMFRFSLIIAK